MSEASVKKKKATKAKKARRAKEKKVLEIKPHEQFQDLCSTCAATPHCIHRTPGYPVHYCEEYEYQAGVSPQVARSADVPEETMILKGLCVNCDNRDTCMHANTEVGVWHCEEYC